MTKTCITHAIWAPDGQECDVCTAPAVNASNILSAGDIPVPGVAQVTPAGKMKIPAQSRVIDAAGKLLLPALYDLHQKDGLEILDFPCNQFGEQAPGSDEGIHSFCTGRFGITFPQFAKIDVNGENAIPLYKFLTENTTFAGFSGPMAIILKPIVKKMDKDYKSNGNIKWNFTKFLIDRNGEIVARFEPTESLEKVKAKVEEAL